MKYLSLRRKVQENITVLRSAKLVYCADWMMLYVEKQHMMMEK